MTEVVIYTQGWMTDHAMKDGEKPRVQVHQRVCIDGHEIENAIGVTTRTSAGNFAIVRMLIAPSSVRYVSCTEEEWKQEDLSDVAGLPA